MKTIPVSQLMTSEVISIDREMEVDDAIRLMRDSRIRRLPVVDKTGRMIGILTLDQAVQSLPKEEPDALFPTLDNEIPKVREVMTDYVYTVASTDSIAKAAQLMLVHKFGGVPVVDDRKLVGIITESDIFRFVVQEYGDA
jgi:CBS domain-containing protein